MRGKRKRYTAEFKAKIALGALRGELTVSQLAAKHGVRASDDDIGLEAVGDGRSGVGVFRARGGERHGAECRG